MVDTAQDYPQLLTQLAALRHHLGKLPGAETPAHAIIEAQQYTIEELQTAEEALRHQHDELLATRQVVEAVRARYAAWFDLAPDGYLVTDAAGVIQETNRAAAALLATSPVVLMGKPLILYVAQEDRVAFRTQILPLARVQRVQDWELRLVPWHGTPFPASLTVALRQPSQEQPPVLYWLLRDLTERKRLEEAQRHTDHLAVLGRLAAGVAHEIRDPLGAIFLHTDNLLEELQQLPPALHASMPESLADIRTECNRLQAIVEDYLSLARLQSLQGTPADLGAAVVTFAQEMRPRCAACGVSLRLEGINTLGTVVLHQHAFRRVLLNLVQNALDAMPEGGILTLRGAHTAAQCTLAVCDTGSGIAPEHLSRLFTPLHTTKLHGTGLGLYVVREIIVAHGGTLAVQSTLGRGTTFTITLPDATAHPTGME
jgi:PAS domain S-box-containing protein